MEEELDDIEEGKIDWRTAMAEFYERFDHDLKHAEEHMTDIKRMEKPTDLICEKCGRPLVVKWGKHGSFLACTGYPDFSPQNADADIEGFTKGYRQAAGTRRARIPTSDRRRSRRGMRPIWRSWNMLKGDAGARHYRPPANDPTSLPEGSSKTF